MQDDFLTASKVVTDWMDAYQRQVEDYPVLSPLLPGDVLKALPTQMPREPEAFAHIFADFQRLIVPGITHWQHPKFFGYFPSNVSTPSMLAEMLVAALGVQCMSWVTSPAATELEIRVMEWLRDFLGLPTYFHGVIQDSASSSTMIAMLVARERATAFAVNEHGWSAENNLVAYCSAEAHSSIEKAAKIIGLGRRNLRKIPTNERQEMRMDLLAEAIEADRREGRRPFFLVGAFGTTGSTAVDHLATMADLAQDHGLWLHVDAAYAGAVLALPEMRALAAGIERADSVVFNPHKWLMTNFDCSAFFVKDKASLLQTFAIAPEYLRTAEDDVVTNFRDWGLGLGRRFRALKLWFVLRWYGAEGLQALLRSHIDLAAKFEDMVREDSRFAVVAPRHFNLLCFRLQGSDALNWQLMQNLNQSGKLFLTHTSLNGELVLRMVIGQTKVEEHHVREAWQALQDEATHLLAAVSR